MPSSKYCLTLQAITVPLRLANTPFAFGNTRGFYMRSATAFLLLTVLVSGYIFPPELHYDVPPYGDKQQSKTLSEQGYISVTDLFQLLVLDC